MTATIILASFEQVQFIRDMPQLVGNGYLVETDNRAVTLPDETLDALAEVPADHDGHFDGTALWIGGTAYAIDGATEVRTGGWNKATRVFETIDREPYVPGCTGTGRPPRLRPALMVLSRAVALTTRTKPKPLGPSPATRRMRAARAARTS